MHNTLLLLQLNAKKSFQRFGRPVDRQEWIGYAPATTNAFYHSFLNKIGQKLSSLILQSIFYILVVPAGILRLPYFDKDVPK